MSRYKLLYPPLDIPDALEEEEVVRRKTTEPSGDGENRTLQSSRRMGYFAVDCFRAAACPRVMEEATLTFRMYRIASVITTLKLAPGTDETKQKEFLALLSFSLRITPFKIKRSWKKMSLWIGLIMSTVLLNPLPLGGRRLVAGIVKRSSSDFVYS